MLENKRTTIVNSAILPKQLGIIPGLELVAWCEDSASDGKSFSVFFEIKGSKYCLHLDVQLDDDYPPCGDHWSLMKREDVMWLIGCNDPEYEGRNYLVSQDPYWIEGIKKQPCFAVSA